MILKNLFRKKYCKYCEYKKAAFYLLDENDKDKEQLKKFDKLVEFLENISDYNEHILYFNKNATKHELVFITVEEEYNYAGRLKYLTFTGYTYGNIYGYDRLKPEMYVEVYQDINNKHLQYFHIVDFLCEPNKGYGSIMMSSFIKYAKSFGIEYISGFLSPVDTSDEEHKQRLIHFYTKFGFEIDDKDNIKLLLNK